MATKYTLTTAFTAITETSGTIQNVGNESVELASSTNAVAGEGIVLNPSEKRSFKGALSARSLGDAGAAVNVVDFTEAGEGGEEYILPIASDTTLGGIKIGNSFTVANDGTLSIKKSGKTILGAVKSSDDEGKVSVNNDGTMTYNPLGYRQPNTVYAAGQIAYHSALPTGWYLECTTAGTSGSGELTISSPSIGGTVSDGTVVWTVCKDIGTGNAPLYAGYNGKQTLTSSGSFTAPITGLYKITLQGGGGGGAGAGNNITGGGGGEGGHLEFYEKLTAGTSYSFTIGAGGTGGNVGADGGGGGKSTITINDNTYSANGGSSGNNINGQGAGGAGGYAKINNTIIERGNSGMNGHIEVSVDSAVSGAGGGTGGGPAIFATGINGINGGGGSGGGKNTTYYVGGNGGDGYIIFEWLDTRLL